MRVDMARQASHHVAKHLELPRQFGATRLVIVEIDNRPLALVREVHVQADA